MENIRTERWKLVEVDDLRAIEQATEVNHIADLIPPDRTPPSATGICVIYQGKHLWHKFRNGHAI